MNSTATLTTTTGLRGEIVTYEVVAVHEYFTDEITGKYAADVTLLDDHAHAHDAIVPLDQIDVTVSDLDAFLEQQMDDARDAQAGWEA